jgi:dUTP pyrophosphatase
MLANSMGIIDNSYRGNLYVALAKISNDAQDINFPFKCCQLILRRQYFMNIVVQTDEFSETHRNDGGFGSTGK